MGMTTSGGGIFHLNDQMAGVRWSGRGGCGEKDKERKQGAKANGTGPFWNEAASAVVATASASSTALAS